MLAHQKKKLPRQGAVKVIDGKEVLDLGTTEGLRKYKERRREMLERQFGLCAICLLWLHHPTFDHEAGRGAGKRDDRILVGGKWQNAALCVTCNGLKGSKRYKWQNGVYRPVEKYKEKAA